MNGESSYVPGPTVEGTPPIQLSEKNLADAMSTATRWRCSEHVFDDLGAAAFECFKHGLIGVSLPILEVMEACVQVARQQTPVLLSGEFGTELDAAARAVHALTYGDAAEMPTLRCAGLTDEVLLQRDIYRGRATAFSTPTSVLDRLLGSGEPNDVLLTEIERAPLSVQRRFASAIVTRGAPRVLATTHQAISDLETMVRDGRFLPELLQRLRSSGRVIEVPPLFMRPEDLPLLIYCCVERFNRGEYGQTDRKVGGVAVEWLYFAASRRWGLNMDELQPAVTEACRMAVRGEGNLRLWSPEGGDTDWPVECPFGLPVKTFLEAAVQGLRQHEVVTVANLPSYDLKGLLETVDTYVKPVDRQHWTIEVRGSHLQLERHGRPLEDGLAAIEVASETQPVEQAQNILRLKAQGFWEVTYSGITETIPSKSNGMRAIAHLLSVGDPKGGAAEVRMAMNREWEVPRTEPEQLLDPQARGMYQEQLANDEEELRAAEEGDIVLEIERRQELEARVQALRKELERGIDRYGRSRTGGGSDDRIVVGEALARALKAIEKGHPALHAHLRKALKNSKGARLRYEPSEKTNWTIEM